MKVPAFSVTGAMGNTTSARSVTALLAQLQADDEGRGFDCGARAVGIGEVVEVDAADEQRLQRSVAAAAARIADVSRPAASGSVVGVPRGRHLGTRGGVGQWSSAGQKVGRRTGFQRATIACSTRHPSQPRAGRRGQARGRRVRTRRIRQPFADAGCRVPGAAVTARSASSAAASPPGAVAITLPPILASPRVANGAIDVTFSPRLRNALRSRRKTIGDSSSGSNPASTTAGADSMSA